MRNLSIGFTAPSTYFEGATISIQCTHYFDGDTYSETAWATNVFAPDGDWVDHPNADTIEDTLEDFISRLVPFYDGNSDWRLDETDRTFTFWEMIVRTLPENMA